MTAEIHFCDLCNESVPQTDIELGRAFMRKGRVVCRRCDQLMTAAGHGELGAGLQAHAGSAPLTAAVAAAAGAHTANQPWTSAGPFSAGGGPSGTAAQLTPTSPPGAPTHAGQPGHGGASWPPAAQGAQGAHHGHAHPHAARSRGGSGAAFGLLGIASALGVWWWAKGEIARVRDGDLTTQSQVQSDVSLLRSQMESSGAMHRERLEGALADVDRKLTEQRDALQKGLGASEQNSKAVAARVQEFEGKLDAMKESVGTIGRHDNELVMLQQRLGTAQASVADLGNRLLEVERSARSAPVLSAVEPPPASPAWQGLLKDLASPDAGARWQAVVSLGDTRDPAVVAHLVPMLRDADLFVKMATARKLGELGSMGAVGALIDTLEDPESGVRSAALGALQDLTKKDFGFDPASTDENERAKRVKAWRDWWAKEQPKLAP